ncbi:YciI family protein [Spirillospora sp. NPDC029432]|uniref:YciI family protein n=1 Tax=Spirillospora sp. NPDC029432 TaxID=3154599 RepID=UPI00345242A1
MKYMLLINSAPIDDAGQIPEDDPCEIQKWIEFDKAITDAGVVVDSASLADLTTATTVRVNEAGERVITTDGPFAETREILGGYYVVDVPDLDAALDWAARCPGARDGGSIVVRPVGDL